MSNLGIILAPYGKIPGAYPSAINYSYGGNGTYLCPPDPQFNTQGEPGFYYDTPLGGASLANSGLTFMQRWKLKRYYKNLAKQASAERVSSPFMGLGDMPTDAELSTMYQYTPVTSGWVAAKEAYFQSPWLPPNGWNQAGAYGPQPQWRGDIRDATTASAANAAAAAGLGPLTPAASAGARLVPASGGIAPHAPVQNADDVISVLNAHNQRVFALTIVSTAAVAVSAILGAYRTVKLLRQRA